MGRRTIAIIIAVILALAAAGLVWWYVSSVREESEAETQTQAVLVATATIPARTTGEDVVANRLVTVQNVPANLVAPGAIGDQNELKGRVVSTEIARGQQIVASQLVAPEAISAVGSQLEKGMRAISLPIDRASAVAGTMKAGDRVDVIASFKNETITQANASDGALLVPAERERVQGVTGVDSETSRSMFTRTIVQQVEILQVDQIGTAAGGVSLGGNQDDQEAAPDEPVVVLKVSLVDAERLVLAAEDGEIWFALVPTSDEEKVQTPGRFLLNAYPQP